MIRSSVLATGHIQPNDGPMPMRLVGPEGATGLVLPDEPIPDGFTTRSIPVVDQYVLFPGEFAVYLNGAEAASGKPLVSEGDFRSLVGTVLKMDQDEQTSLKVSEWLRVLDPGRDFAGVQTDG